MASDPQEHDSPDEPIAGHVGFPRLKDDVFTTFTKYGLLGCCVGFICMAFWYQQHEATKTLAWAFARIESEQVRAAELIEAEQIRSRAEREALAATLNRALDEIKSTHREVAGTRTEIRKVQKAVESIE